MADLARDEFDRPDSAVLGTSTSGHLWTSASTSSIGVSNEQAALSGNLVSSLGLYVGPGTSGNITILNNFGTALGNPVVYANDYFIPFAPDDSTWNPTAADNWGTWKAADPDRHCTFGVHLTPAGGTLAAGNSGTYDSNYTTLADLLISEGLGDSVIRLGYEANNANIGTWQATTDPTGYINLYRRAHGIMSGRPGANFTFDWDVAIGQAGVLATFDDFYPGDAYVDICGFNIYDVWYGGTPPITNADRWNNIQIRAMGLNEYLDFAEIHQKPVSFPEWGLYDDNGDGYNGGGDDTYFIEQMINLFNVTHPVYQAYFNYDWGGGVMSDFPLGEAAYEDYFGNIVVGTDDAVSYIGTALDFSNVRIEAEIAAIEDQDEDINTDGWGIRFRRSDESNWWEFGMDPLTSFYALRKTVGGVLFIVNVSGTEWAAGDIVKVEAFEERINCYVNQRMIVSVTDTDLMANENVGLRVTLGSVAARLDHFYALELLQDIRLLTGYLADYQVLVDWDNDNGLYLGDFETESGLTSWTTFGTRLPDIEQSTTYVHSGNHSMEIGWNIWNLFQFDVAGHGFSQGQFAGDEYGNPINPFKFNQAGQGFDDGRFAAFKTAVDPIVTEDSFVAPGVYKQVDNLVIGRVYTVHMWVYVPTGSTGVSIGVMGIGTVANTLSDQWEEVTYTYTATAVSHLVYIVSNTTNPGADEVCYIDEAMNIGAYEDITCYVLNQRNPLRFLTGRDEARSLASISPTEVEMDCLNDSQIFSPDNPGSPLHGFLEPGKKMKIRATYNNRTSSLFHGFVDNYTLHPDIQDRYVTFTCMDGLQYLANAIVSTEVYPSIQTGQAIEVLLDAVDWPEDRRDIEAGATTIKWWSEDGTDGLSAVQSLVQAEGVPSSAFVDNFGNFVFKSRHHRLTESSSTNIQTTVKADPDFDEPVFSGPLEYDIGWKDIINRIDVEIENRILKEIDEVWSQDDLVVIPAGQLKTIKVQASSPFYKVQTLTTGFEDALEFDRDIGKDIVYKTGSGVLASINLTRTSGSSTEIQLTAGGTDVTIKSIRLRAFSVDTADALKIFRENSDSVTRFGPKNSEVDFPWINTNDMDAVAQIILGTRAERLPVIHFNLNNAHPVRISHFLDMDLHERLHIVEALQTFLDDDFYLETIEHTISNSGSSHVTTFGCEKARDQKVVIADDESTLPTFTFDVTGQGFDQGYFTAGSSEGLSLSDSLFILDQSRLDEDGLGY